MEHWCVIKSGKRFIVRDEEKNLGEISDVIASRAIGSVNIKITGEDQLLSLSLSKYKPGPNDSFSSCLSSRTRFVEKWNEISKDYSADLETQQEEFDGEEGGYDEPEYQAQQADNNISLHHTDKLAYNYVLVHVKNMVQPAEERRFRDVDEQHVEDLKAKIVKNPDLKCRIMLGNTTVSKEGLSENLLKSPGKVEVEVIGGNHTRTAIMKILEDPDYKHDSRFLVWPMKIYSQLDRIQAQKLVFDHNIENETVRPTTAFEMLQFVRKELHAVTDNSNVYSAPQLKVWKAHIMHILDLTKTDLHNKYKTLLNLAKCSSHVWEKILLFGEQWRRGDIKGQAPSELKTGHLKSLSLLCESDLIKTLDALIQKELSWTEFKKGCSKKKNQVCSDEAEDPGEQEQAFDQATQTTQKQLECQQKDKRENDHSKDLKKKLDLALATVRNLTAETEILRSKLADSESKNEKAEEKLKEIQKGNVELMYEVSLLKSQKKELEDDVSYYLHKLQDRDQSLAFKRRDTDQSDSPQRKKRTCETEEIVESDDEIMEIQYNCVDEKEPPSPEETKYEVVLVEYRHNTAYLAVEDKEMKKIRYAKGRIMKDIEDIKTYKNTNLSTTLEKTNYSFEEKYKACTFPKSLVAFDNNKIVIKDDKDLKKHIQGVIDKYICERDLE